MAYLSPEEAADDALLAAAQGRADGRARPLLPRAGATPLAVERTLPNVRVLGARSTPDQLGDNRVPLRSATAANLYFADDARDLPLNSISEMCLATSIEVADAIAAAGSMEHRSAIAVA